jgi:ABC-2 type transport system ATP-binding protein
MVIETQALTKFYGGKLGCSNISLSIGKGEVFALLGPNGAGKSTFVKMLTGLIFPSSGQANVLGKPLGDVLTRRKIGYLPENFKYQEWMTGSELLSFHASLYKLNKPEIGKRISEVLNLVRLKGSENNRIGTYSKGMQQRIGIASSLLSDPELLFLDEPTSALDPIGRKEVREIITELKSRGKTILLNSHLLSEVEMICDHAAIIDKGSIIRYGKMEEILESKLILEIQAKNISPRLVKALGDYGDNIVVENEHIIMNIGSRELIHQIATIIIENGAILYELFPRHESLENVFINLVNGEDL